MTDFNRKEFIDDDPELVHANKAWNDFCDEKKVEIQAMRTKQRSITENPENSKKMQAILLAEVNVENRKLLATMDTLRHNVSMALKYRDERLAKFKQANPKHDLVGRFLDDTLVDSLVPQHEPVTKRHFSGAGSRDTKVNEEVNT